jgi:RES domain-containing protein
MLQPHPLYTFFAEQLSLTSPKSWRGVGFRSVVPRYANARDMISGAGAFRGGGRWNTPGVHAVYASLEPGLSVNEAMGVVFSDRGFSVSDIRPRLVAGLRCQLNAVIDLKAFAPVVFSQSKAKKSCGGSAVPHAKALAFPSYWATLISWIR